MKKVYYLYPCIGLLVSLLFFSCGKDFDDHENRGRAGAQVTLSVNDARKFFEKEFIQMAMTKSGDDKKLLLFNPGEFTPNWDNAKTYANAKLSSVDVAINSQYNFHAIRSEFVNGKAYTYEVPVYQKLVLLESKKNQSIGSCLLTLIPNEEFAQKNKGDFGDKFITIGNKNKFSGIALYSDVITERIILIQKYSNGIVKESAFFSDNKDLFEKNVNKAKELLAGIRISRDISVMTRSIEDDKGGLTDEDWDQFWNDHWENYWNNYYNDYYNEYWKDYWNNIWWNELGYGEYGTGLDYSEVSGAVGDYGSNGSNGGGGGTAPPPTTTPDTSLDELKVIAPKSSKIFYLDPCFVAKAEAEKLETFITEITNDCMGLALYNALINGGKLINLESGDSPGYYRNQNKILYAFNRGSETLLHELMHVLQRREEMNAPSLGFEVEAYYAEYLFLSKKGITPLTLEDDLYNYTEFGFAFKNMREFSPLTQKGQLMPGIEEAKFHELFCAAASKLSISTGGIYDKTLLDPDKFGTENIKYLQQILKDC